MADEDIRIRAELEGALERDVESAADAVDDLGDQAVATAAQLQIMEAAAGGAARELRDLDAEAARAERRLRDIGKGAVAGSRDVDQATSSLGRMQGMLAKFKGLNLGGIMRSFKIPAIVTGLTLAATAVSALGAAGVAAVAGLSPLVALSAALPAALGAGAQAMGVAKLAFSGMGEALKAMASGDAAKASEALAKLSPPARRFARELDALRKGPVAGLKADLAGSGLFPGLSAGVASAARLFPVLRRNMTDTADVMGDLAESAGRVMGTPLFSGQLDRIMSANTNAIRNGGQAAGFFARALVHVVDAFAPVFSQISASTRGLGQFTEQAARAGNESGRMGAFFQRAWDLAQATGQVLEDVAVGIFNVGSGAGVMADKLGGGIERGARAFRDWTSSLAGQASIRDWFADAIPVVTSMIRLVGAIGAAFGRLASNKSLAPVIDQIRTEALPAFEALAAGVTTRMGPALVSAATAFAKLNNVLSYSPIVMVLEGAAKAMSAFADVVMLLPGPIRTAVAGLLAFSLATKALGFVGSKAVAGLSPLTSIIRGVAAPAGTAAAGLGRLERAGIQVGTALRTVHTSAQSGSAGLTGLARVGGTAAGAMRGIAAATKGLGAGLMGALGGPWGVALMAGVAALTIFASKQADAKARVDDLKSSLNQQTGAITTNTAAVAAKQLQDAGAFKAANNLGLSVRTVTQAALGNAGAMRTVSAAVDANLKSSRGLNGANREASQSAHTLKEVLGDQGGALATAVRETRELAAATSGGVGAVDRMTAAERRGATALNAAGGAAKRAAMGTGQVAGQSRVAAAAAASHAGRTRQQTAALQALASQTRRNMGGMIAFRQAIADGNKAIKGGSGALSTHTQRGRDNRTAMINLAEAATQVGGSAKRQRAAMIEARNKIVEWSIKAKVGEGRAIQFANRVTGLNSEVRKMKDKTTRVKVEGTEKATRDVIGVRGVIGSLRDRTVQIRADASVAMAQAARVRSELANLRFAGGPVEPGQTYTVGEIGPEIFRAASGAMSIVGKHGIEKRSFPQAGEILPSYVLDAVRAATAREPAVAVTAPAAPAGPAGRRSSELVPSPPVHFHIDGSTMSKADMVAAAREAYAAIVRDEEGRRIRHAGFNGLGGPV